MPYVNGQRTYTNPMNDPNSPRYWNRGGQGAPSFPGAGQTGPGYGITDGRGFGGGQQSNTWANVKGEGSIGGPIGGPMVPMGPGRFLGSESSAHEKLGTDAQSWAVPMGGSASSLGNYAGYRSGPLPQPNLGYGFGQLGNPMGVTGWQSGVQPGMYPQVDPQEQARRKMLQQQQPQQAYGNPFSLSGPIGGIPQMPGLQQYTGGPIQGPTYQVGQYTQPQQSVTQPFQTTPPWQQRVPQNFNQGSAYGPFVRGW